MPESSPHTREDSGVGQWLQRTRESKGVSLEQAAAATRITKNYIDALEQENFTRLPAPAYCKGFIRLYAIYLGIPPDEAVARYERVTGAKEAVRRVVNERPHTETSSNQKSRHRLVLPLILFSIVVLMSLVIDRDQSSPPRRPTPRPEPVLIVQPVPAQTALSSTRSIPSQLPATATTPEPTTPPPPALPGETVQQDGLVLSLKINQDSWLNVDIDGLVSKQYDLKAGDLIEWKADSSITLDIGNAGGVEGELNDKPLPSFGAVGKKAHAVIRPEGVVLQ